MSGNQCWLILQAELNHAGAFYLQAFYLQAFYLQARDKILNNSFLTRDARGMKADII